MSKPMNSYKGDCCRFSSFVRENHGERPLISLTPYYGSFFYEMKIKIGITTVLFIATYLGYHIFLSFNPGIAYRLVSGISLPNGVSAIGYASKLNDNLFHSGHYWEFTHNKTGLNLLLKQIGAGDRYEDYQNMTDFQVDDAICVLPNIEYALGKTIPKTSIGRGYEIYRKAGRDSWLLISKSGDHSYYELN
jgi:hypothetical protein